MRKQGWAVALLGAVAMVLVVSAGPVQATTGGYVTSPGPGVLYDDCRDVAVPYSLTLDAGTDYWNLTVDAYGPDGTEQTSDYVYSSAYPTTGVAHLQFCGGEDPGTYTIRATGETSDYDSGVDSQFALPSVTFAMRQPHSTTTLRRTYKRNANLLTVAVTDERPNGYFPTKDAGLRLQVLRRSTWHTISGTRESTDYHGRHVYRLRHVSKTTRVRAITIGDSDYEGSASRSVRLR